MSNYWAILIAALLAVSPPSAAGQRARDDLPTIWNVREYPNPYSLNQGQQRNCGRYNQSYVCDPNSIISTTQADAIDAEIENVMRETPCVCPPCHSKSGFKIRVAIMPEMERVLRNGNSRREQLRDARVYAYILSRRWQMEGQCNNHLLILYSRNDAIIYTLTPPNRPITFTNQLVTRITLMTRQYFENSSSVAEGLIQMIRRYSLALKGKLGASTEPGTIGG